MHLSSHSPGAPDAPGSLRAFDVEVFRAGDYGPKGTYDVATLEAIARRYRTAPQPAPVTFDHAQDGPAHGWVEALECRGDVLVARVAQPSPELLSALAGGRFRHPSIELDAIDSPEGPTLRAVSFLGARLPEVKGLTPAFGEVAPEPSFTHAHGLTVGQQPGPPHPRHPLHPLGEELHRQTLAFAAQHPDMAYSEALRCVARRLPAYP